MSSQPDHHDSTPGADGVPAALHQIRREVRDLADTLWAARDRAELMDTVAEIEALKSTLDALELGVVRELEATSAVKTVGWASTQDFLTAVAGGHKGTGPADRPARGRRSTGHCWRRSGRRCATAGSPPPRPR